MIFGALSTLTLHITALRWVPFMSRDFGVGGELFTISYTTFLQATNHSQGCSVAQKGSD